MRKNAYRRTTIGFWALPMPLAFTTHVPMVVDPMKSSGENVS